MTAPGPVGRSLSEVDSSSATLDEGPEQRVGRLPAVAATTPHLRLRQLLDYVLEQDKDINPRGFHLSTHSGFVRSAALLADLPGVTLDQDVAGDHVWLRVERITSEPTPPQLPVSLQGLVVVDSDPSGEPPRWHEAALRRHLDRSLGRAREAAAQGAEGTQGLEGVRDGERTVPSPAAATAMARQFDLLDADPQVSASAPRALIEKPLWELMTDDAAVQVQTPLPHVAARRRAEQRLRAPLEAALADYAQQWAQWAGEEAPRRQALQLYGELFTLKHQLDTETVAQPQELVWGLGVAAWKTGPVSGALRGSPAKASGKGGARGGSAAARSSASQGGGVDFQYPLLTQVVELTLDEATLALELRPRAVEPRWEFDAFAACELPGIAEVERVAIDALARQRDRPVTPFDVGSFEPLLRWVAGNLHPQGRYEPGASQWPMPEVVPVVTDAWVLLSRPKANKDTHADIGRLKAVLEANESAAMALPDGPLALVTPPSDQVSEEAAPVTFRGRSGRTAVGRLEGWGDEGPLHELYFPLPYNQEQMTIIEQLARHSGVAVQGPPGTGKTHTIANIVCHYLATGRKVLVTSKGQQALEVLQSKIPASVRPLTVALLAGDREGLRQFQASIEAILHNVSQLQPSRVKADIQGQHERIHQAHAELALIDRRIDELAEAQLGDIEVDGVTLRAQKMADLVVNGAEQHAWFDDILSMDADHAPPLDAAQTALLRETRRRLGTDLVYAALPPPTSTGLPSVADMGRLHEALQAVSGLQSEVDEGRLWPLRGDLTPRHGKDAQAATLHDDARELLSRLDQAIALTEALNQTQVSWADALRAKCTQARYDSEREALESLFDDMADLIAARGEFLKRPVDLPDSILTSHKAREAIERGAQSGRPFAWLSFGQGEIKTQIGAVRVAGLVPTQAGDWHHVQRYLALHEQVLSFSVRWNAVAEALSVPPVHPGVHALRDIEHVGGVVRKVHALATAHDLAIWGGVKRVFADLPFETTGVVSLPLLQQLRDQLQRHLTLVSLSKATLPLKAVHDALSGTGGPVAEAMRTWVTEELGRSAHRADAVAARYSELLTELGRLEGLTSDFDTLHALAERFAQAGAPRLAERLRTCPVNAAGDDEVLPVHWREAWTWARVKALLDDIDGRDELRRLAARRHELEDVLAHAYEAVVAQSAWLSTKQGASPRVLSALETYRTAVRRIGQGTGPNATRHRRDAQRAMHDAQGAVPCWIMTHAKVSETMPATLGGFDLVIVDEASQSDLWALPAILRGKQVLVVGDDKQVSPDGGFMSAVRIQELKDRFLGEQPFAAVLTPEKSMYDVAATVFAASKVMLREHFRCVPPIIAYSNRTFYKDFIQPLRLPKASERLDPPLIDIFVPSGQRDANDINREEALAIAAEVEAILVDPRLKGRTLGVVSLLGFDQAQYIDKLVRSRCDASELLRRKFECGDARVFQGSERDIMFLSMVASPGDCRALSGNMFEQRFNVAASRARDRMVLVRSVQATDLSSADLRSGLLAHFAHPMGGEGGPRASQGEDAEAPSLIEHCESGFEREVYTELFERGYRVVPQVKAGSFRIDMVVEGGNDTRLAIECDGDAFHGLDRWQADMSRQRVLERAGWTFWRCFASTWTMRRDEVLQDLLDTLEAMGIEPLGALAQLPALVERRVWSSVRGGNGSEDGSV